MSDCYPTHARCTWIPASISRADIPYELLVLVKQPLQTEATWVKTSLLLLWCNLLLLSDARFTKLCFET